MSSDECDGSSGKTGLAGRIRKRQTIPYELLIQLYKAGFRKLIPLLLDSKRANVYDHLVTDEEIKQFPSVEGKPVRLIYQIPNFWTEKRLKEKAHLFYNVATTFGLTDLTDSKGRILYLYGVDVDTKEAYEALKELLEMLKGITYVVKTQKEYGYHFYILTPVFHKELGRANFRLGAEIEIKTDLSLGMMHLPPSRHRKYPYWNYKRISTSENIYVDEDDVVFQQILKAMSPYLRKEPTEGNVITLDTYPPQSTGPSIATPGLQQRQLPNRALAPEQIQKTIDIILNKSNSYVETARNDFVYGLSGYLFHNGISEASAINLVSILCKEANDEEADARLDVVSETYKKGKTGMPIKGISQLKDLLAKYNNESEVRVNEVVAQLNEALKISNAINGTGNISTTSSSLGREDVVADEIVRLAESNGDIFFKDTFGQPYSILNHMEVVSMDTKKFAYHLRSLLKHNRNKRIISNDSRKSSRDPKSRRYT